MTAKSDHVFRLRHESGNATIEVDMPHLTNRIAHKVETSQAHCSFDHTFRSEDKAMTRKRGNNEGSITKLPSGSFRAQITLDGKRLNYTARTRKECQEWLRKTLNHIDEGLTFKGTQITTGEYLTGWLIDTKPSLRPKPAHQYGKLIENHIIPALGKVKLKDLRPGHINALYRNRLESGIGTRTIRYIHSTLHRALQVAVNQGLLTRNPASGCTPPRYVHDEMTIFNESQVTTFLIAARGSRHEALYTMAVKTGMRQGELLGLKWSDLDWTTGQLQVKRQVQRVKGQGFVFLEPKTRSGRRTVQLGEAMLQALRKHKEMQDLEKSFAGARWQEYDLIFASTVGTATDLNNLGKEFRKILATTGLPKIRFHDLRHTAASIMLKHNIPVLTVSRFLGHARASITLDIYGHLIPGMIEEVGKLMDDVITPVPVDLEDLDAEVMEELGDE